MEYFPDHGKLFLNRLIDRIGSKDGESADKALTTILAEAGKEAEYVALDVPLNLPPCISCKLKCPGYESCKVAEVAWMRKEFKRRDKKRKANKPFTPYTERGVEIYLSSGLEEPFHLSHALGANAAPLTARAHFLKKHVEANLLEVAPKVSVWRIGRSLKIAKSHLRFHRHAVGGDESREVMLNALCEKQVVFMYQQDVRLMVQDGAAFESFVAALTAYLMYKGQCEARPKGFPRKAGWIHFPKEKISW